MKRHIVLLTLLLIAAPVGKLLANPEAPSVDASAKPSTVHFSETSWGAPVVALKITEKITGHFVIDTNNHQTFLSTQFASRLKLKAKIVKNGSGTIPLVLVPRLEYGSPDMRSVNMPFYVGDMSGYMVNDPDIDGILGANVLAAMAVVIDPQKKEVTFWGHGNLSDDELKTAGFDEAGVMDLTTPANDFHYSVKAHFKNGTQSHDVALAIDTGTAYSQVTRSDALAIGAPILPVKDKSGAEETSPETTALGNVNINNFTYVISPKATNKSALGLSFLYIGRVLFDCPARKLYFAMITTPTPPKMTSIPHSHVQIASASIYSMQRGK